MILAHCVECSERALFKRHPCQAWWKLLGSIRVKKIAGNFIQKAKFLKALWAILKLFWTKFLFVGYFNCLRFFIIFVAYWHFTMFLSIFLSTLWSKWTKFWQKVYMQINMNIWASFWRILGETLSLKIWRDWARLQATYFTNVVFLNMIGTSNYCSYIFQMVQLNCLLH